MCFGHTHKPYHRVIHTSDGEKNQFYHAVNIGSAGKPKDGDARGCYVLLTLQQDSSQAVRDSISVEFVRFNYDIEKAAVAIEKSPLPNKYAAMLRKAG